MEQRYFKVTRNGLTAKRFDYDKNLFSNTVITAGYEAWDFAMALKKEFPDSLIEVIHKTETKDEVKSYYGYR